MVKSKRKVDSHKVWLGIGISVAVLLLAVLLLYPLLTQPSGEKKAMAGKAGEATGLFNVESKHMVNGVQKAGDSPNVGSCPDKNQCLAGNGECSDSGKLKTGDNSWYCGPDNDWYKCSDKYKYVTSNDKYFCNGIDDEWKECSSTSKGNYHLSSTKFYYCGGSSWQSKTGTGVFTASNILQYVASDEKWTITASEKWYEKGRFGFCDKSYSCIATDGTTCKSFDDVRSGGSDYVCGMNQAWQKCTESAKGQTSFGGGWICTKVGTKWQWAGCTSDDNVKTESHTCILKLGIKGSERGQWVPNTVGDTCKNKCGDNEFCLFSNVITKMGNYPSASYDNVVGEGAETTQRIGCGTGAELSKCITKNKNKIDYGETAGGFVCGTGGDWIKCTSDMENVVADGGKYICDGTDWKKITDLSPKNIKGCSEIKPGEYCVVSNKYTYEASGWEVTKYAYASGRVGISSGQKGCVSKNGISSPTGIDKTDQKWYCAGDKGNWLVCNTAADKRMIAGKYCDGNTGWIPCDDTTEGTTFDSLVCKSGEWGSNVPTGGTTTETLCFDGKDDDSDGDTDCKDSDCNGKDALNKQKCVQSYIMYYDSTKKLVVDATSQTPTVLVGRSDACPSTAYCVKTGSKDGNGCTLISTLHSTNDDYICGAFGIWIKCTTDGLNQVAGDYTCGSTGWAKKITTTGVEDCAAAGDEDNDNLVNCADPDCKLKTFTVGNVVAACEDKETILCKDNFDNDGDGKVDCVDTDCAANAACAIDCTNSANWKNSVCVGQKCSTVDVNKVLVWTYNLPDEGASALGYSQAPTNPSCCVKDSCAYSSGTSCAIAGTVTNEYLCGTNSNWWVCGNNYYKDKSSPDGTYTCNSVKWEKKTETTLGDVNNDKCVNDVDISTIADNINLDCVGGNPPSTLISGDVNNDGCVNDVDISTIADNINLDCVPPQ